MKHRKILTLTVAIVIAVSVPVSYAGQRSQQPKMQQTKETQPTLAAVSDPQGKITHLAIGTGGAGGAFYYVGGAMAQVINKYVKGVNAVAEASPTVAQNIKMVQAKEQSLALQQPEGVFHAFKGLKNPWNLPFCPDLRIVSAGHDQVLHVAALAKSGIKTMRDVNGKKVAVGSAASKPIAIELLKFHGVPESNIRVRFLPLAEQASELKDGTLDVGTFHSGLPVPAIIELTSTENVNFLPIEPNAMKELQKAHPYWWTSVTPAAAYKGQDKDIPTLGSGSCLFTHKDMPEELIYQITKAIIEHNSEMVEIHKACKYYTLEQTKKYVESGVFGGVPFHPGAARYYREKGILR